MLRQWDSPKNIFSPCSQMEWISNYVMQTAASEILPVDHMVLKLTSCFKLISRGHRFMEAQPLASAQTDTARLVFQHYILQFKRS